MGAKQTEPGSFQQCTVPGQEATGTKWTQNVLPKHQDALCYSVVDCTGANCPEMLQYFLLWRSSKARLPGRAPYL